MSQVFVDANVPMYAAGAPHPLREPAQRVIVAVASGQLDAVTDAEVLQGILYWYLQIGEREKGLRVFDHFYRVMLGHILPVTDADMLQARVLAEQYPGLAPRDLVHLAIMRTHQIREIVTADRGFDAVTDIQRIDPSTFDR